MPTAPPRWLDADEHEAWLALVKVLIRLPPALDSQLQRDSSLNHFEYLVMTVLSTSPTRTLGMSEVATLTGSSLSRLSHLVKRLGARGLLLRAEDPSDGRCTTVTLTDAGFEVLSGAAPGHLEEVRALVVDALSREQLAQLAAIASTVLARLEAGTLRR